jgi:hypothetical protein
MSQRLLCPGAIDSRIKGQDGFGYRKNDRWC